MPKVFLPHPEPGHSLFYSIDGRPGEKSDIRSRLLFLSGMGGRHSDFKRYTAHFAQTCHVCSIDHAGSGFSEMPSKAWRLTTAGMAEDVLHVLDDLGWCDGIHVVGHCLGGMVAQELALLVPERIASLSLVSTFASVLSTLPTFEAVTAIFQNFTKTNSSSRAYDLLFPKSWLTGSRKSEFHGESVVSNERWLRRLLKRVHSQIPDEFQSTHKAVPLPTAEVLRWQLSAVLTHNVSKQRFRTVRRHGHCFSVLVLTGSDDLLIPPENSKILSSVVDGRLVVLSGAGHGVMFQCEEEVKAAIQKNILAGETVRKVGSIVV